MHTTSGLYDTLVELVLRCPPLAAHFHLHCILVPGTKDALAFARHVQGSLTQ